ncbi:C2 calcium/lipid-binding plant phosphoribosyltransferase family protein [Abeliophyllum distichum]|uniref:C2 calcium/lipid-binding plant phosphoribosyltransferase family protein n=1 Tax=Abeliophyllum distichum TaxID=126358 RepID=A0ABD1SAH3_9LAMI
MAKVVIEVLDASDLMPKDGHGSANPFVEVDFDEQRQRTSTKLKTLNPSWNEKLVFDIKNLRNLPNNTIEVLVYNDNKHGHYKNFLGKVRISGMSIPFSDSEPMIQRYPLDKRGIFSHIKGDIALKIYAVVHGTENLKTEAFQSAEEEGMQNLKREVPEKNKKKKKEKELRTFHALGNVLENPAEKPVIIDSKSDISRAMHIQFPGQKPEYALVETRPPLAARMGYWGRDKTASTYDLVEQMNFLYVNVVKANDLPIMDISGSLDPYVEVRIGNYKGVTNHFEKNQNPVWNKVFAFAKERLQSHLIEITVKDKDVAKDDFVGRIVFDIGEVPVRVPPDSPMAPQWYRLEKKTGQQMSHGEIMLAVWMGTQADEAFPEAWHSDSHSMNQTSLADTRSKVYFSPKLYYLRVHVIAAQDLVPSEKGRNLETSVRIKLGDQGRVTRNSPIKHINPEWNEELMFIAYEPFDEYMVFSVVETGGGQDEVLGMLMKPVREFKHRLETSKLPDAEWFSLYKPYVAEEESDMHRKDGTFRTRIYLRLWIDAGYHVLDESQHFTSDLQPAAKSLRKSSVGILEVGFLGAQNLLPMKDKDGGTTDAYCVAKYGNKWVRTRTLVDTLNPRWNEQYTWEVFDPCTVITIGVFDNCHITGKEDAKDQRIGKIRIRLSTLEADEIYTHFYPLLVLQPSGLKKNGELHLAIRFTCTAWVNMVTQYGKPLFPKMHYVHPISLRHIEWLRHQATDIVVKKLARAEPPLRGETVEYMLDVDYNAWSLRRSKAYFARIMVLMNGISYVLRWFDGICYWKNPVTTILVHILFFILVCYPELILPTFFLYLFVIGLWNYRFRPRHPPYMDAQLSQADVAHPDEVDEEFDSFPTSRQTDIVKMRYDRLRSVAGKVQSVAGDLATQGERVLAVLSWRDPRATALFIIFSLICAVFLYITPFQIVAIIIGLYVLRHPRFRYKLPPVPVNFFRRLPSKSDMLL